MTCDEIKILLMDFLYNEIEPESEKLVRAHLQNCPACRSEYETLNRTSLTLKIWENEEPRLHVVFVRESKSWWAALKEKILPAEAPAWGKLVGVSAGIILGVLLISALLNLEISFKNGDFTYRASLVPRAAQSGMARIDSQLVMQIQQQAYDTYQRMLLASQQQQREDFNRTLAQLAAELNRQRQSDLLLVGRGLDEFQQHTYSRLNRNDQVLNQLLRSVKFQPQQ
ncbi:MAG: zf-HC2 domain-containing protein [candidate division KSB1 bacterium]|nr:zf-HC2 domain-containing protein [candidate division KSB1 bacterium]MDZ7305196.1 zf-HC2 domain-containing protein [candidate division KSB1 bacterium]MDZ7314291.1 zf-HC2 domain-containing protein [candidate division KSB1 bacterium]